MKRMRSSRHGSLSTARRLSFAGAKREHVVLVYLLSATLSDRFEAAHVGKLSVTSMAKVDALLRLALDVP